MAKKQKCAVSHVEAGSVAACNDCDPCLSVPLETCRDFDCPEQEVQHIHLPRDEKTTHDCHKQECLKTWRVLHCEKCAMFDPDIPGECCLWAEIRRLQGLADLRRKAEEQLLRERTELAAEVGRTNSEINRVMEVGQNEIADLMARLSVDNGMMQATEDRADKAEKIVAYFREALQDMVDDGDVDPVTRIWAQELLEGAK